MNGFADHSELSDVDFGEKKGVSIKTFDAFRTCAPLDIDAANRDYSKDEANIPHTNTLRRAMDACARDSELSLNVHRNTPLVCRNSKSRLYR